MTFPLTPYGAIRQNHRLNGLLIMFFLQDR